MREVYADPLVIRDESRGIGVEDSEETPQRDRSLQDGTLVYSLPEGAVMIELNEDGGTIADTQDAAMQVIYIALAIIAAGGVLNHFVKKRYYE